MRRLKGNEFFEFGFGIDENPNDPDTLYVTYLGEPIGTIPRKAETGYEAQDIATKYIAKMARVSPEWDEFAERFRRIGWWERWPFDNVDKDIIDEEEVR